MVIPLSIGSISQVPSAIPHFHYAHDYMFLLFQSLTIARVPQLRCLGG
jgi:hypothetical protein